MKAKDLGEVVRTYDFSQATVHFLLGIKGPYSECYTSDENKQFHIVTKHHSETYDFITRDKKVINFVFEFCVDHVYTPESIENCFCLEGEAMSIERIGRLYRIKSLSKE